MPCRAPNLTIRPLALALLLAVVLTLAVTACGRHGPSSTAEVPGGGTAERFTVVHAVDGDTVDLRTTGGHVERVRLLGIDTPETVKPNTPVQCWGPQASARTKALLSPGSQVLAQRDQEARDKYGRLLLYLWRAQDHLFVNRSLVADGFARTLSIEPNTAHRSDLGDAASAAQRAGRGLWSRCTATGSVVP